MARVRTNGSELDTRVMSTKWDRRSGPTARDRGLEFAVGGARTQFVDQSRAQDQPPVAFFRAEDPEGGEHGEALPVERRQETLAGGDRAVYQ